MDRLLFTPKDDIFTLEETADWLHVSPSTIYRHVNDGALPGFKIGRVWRFKRAEIERWMADLENNNRKAR